MGKSAGRCAAVRTHRGHRRLYQWHHCCVFTSLCLPVRDDCLIQPHVTHQTSPLPSLLPPFRLPRRPRPPPHLPVSRYAGRCVEYCRFGGTIRATANVVGTLRPSLLTTRRLLPANPLTSLFSPLTAATRPLSAHRAASFCRAPACSSRGRVRPPHRTAGASVRRRLGAAAPPALQPFYPPTPRSVPSHRF